MAIYRGPIDLIYFKHDKIKTIKKFNIDKY